MTSQAAIAVPETGNKILGIPRAVRRRMPKQKNLDAMSFGERMAELRKAAGYTQLELADQLGVSRRMIAYYEGQSEHPPTTLVPALAQALHVTTDELFGIKTARPRNGRAPDTRLQRRLQQIERMPASEKRHILHMLDTFIEHARYKQQAKA